MFKAFERRKLWESKLYRKSIKTLFYLYRTKTNIRDKKSIIKVYKSKVSNFYMKFNSKKSLFKKYCKVEKNDLYNFNIEELNDISFKINENLNEILEIIDELMNINFDSSFNEDDISNKYEYLENFFKEKLYLIRKLIDLNDKTKELINIEEYKKYREEHKYSPEFDSDGDSDEEEVLPIIHYPILEMESIKSLIYLYKKKKNTIDEKPLIEVFRRKVNYFYTELKNNDNMINNYVYNYNIKELNDICLKINENRDECKETIDELMNVNFDSNFNENDMINKCTYLENFFKEKSKLITLLEDMYNKIDIEGSNTLNKKFSKLNISSNTNLENNIKLEIPLPTTLKKVVNIDDTDNLSKKISKLIISSKTSSGDKRKLKEIPLPTTLKKSKKIINIE